MRSRSPLFVRSSRSCLTVSAVASAPSREVPRMGSREERRLSMKIGLGLFAFVLALGLFAWRPATLVGVSDESLARSLGNEGQGSCAEVEDSQWECEIVTDAVSGGGSRMLYVETRAWGCWGRLERS